MLTSVNQGNPLARYEHQKSLTQTEQVKYEIALLERELLKKDGEIARLKYFFVSTKY